MKISLHLFDIYFLLLVVSKGLGLEADNVVYKIAVAIGTVMIVMKVLREKYQIKELLSMMTVLIIGILDLLVGQYSAILITTIGIIGLKNVDLDRVIKKAFFLKLITFLIMIIWFGFLKDGGSVMMFERSGNIIERYSFGYSHPNLAHENLTVTIMLLLYIYHSRLKSYHYIALVAAELLFFKFTNSRTGLVIGLLSIFLSILIRDGRIRNIIKFSFKEVYFILIGISIILPLCFANSKVVKMLDVLFTGRIRALTALYQMPLPKIIGDSSYSAMTNFDNGFITLLYLGGIAAFVWFIYYLNKSYKLAYEKNETLKYVLMIEFALYSLMESFFCNIALNMSLLFIADVLFAKAKDMEASKEGICRFKKTVRRMM